MNGMVFFLKNNGLFLLSLVALLAHSCREQAFYEMNEPVPDRNWTYGHVPAFEVRIADTAARYDVFLRVRHTSAYPFSNLFLLLHEKGPGLRDTAFRHEMKLAELDGRWTGTGAGGLFDNELLAKKDFVFPDTGVYRFAVEQNMRENPLREVADVGIKLLKKP